MYSFPRVKTQKCSRHPRNVGDTRDELESLLIQWALCTTIRQEDCNREARTYHRFGTQYFDQSQSLEDNIMVGWRVKRDLWLVGTTESPCRYPSVQYGSTSYKHPCKSSRCSIESLAAGAVFSRGGSVYRYRHRGVLKYRNRYRHRYYEYPKNTDK